jgi:uncharacterized protein YwgA
VNRLQPTYKRQRFLLAYIRQQQEGMTLTDLQKSVFQYAKQTGSVYYDFISYEFGSYSFQLAEDIDVLRRDGYVSAETSCIQANDIFPSKTTDSCSSEQCKKLEQKAHRQSPINDVASDITFCLIKGEDSKRFMHSSNLLDKPEQILFTIGYEGKSVETFINSLIKHRIHTLVDVRKNPLSRKFGFSKGRLKQITTTAGIKYIHIPDLGIESDKRIALATIEDYRYLFKGYEISLPNYTQQLDLLHSLLRVDARIALMCFEKESEMCHRHVLRDYFTKVYGIRGVDI